ncbi:alpha/beta fold hydrolase [Fretibacter rubidus]|uniref:alpha/beta fold hydrolase n=1 Tax=Fretibacter rubidus TaxID=570162 RepID=UPI00352B21DD
MTKAYDDVFYVGEGGLKLYARDYGDDRGDRPVVLCMHGLTRNSADFHNLALILSDRYRVISVDQRGRGWSDYDTDISRYRPDIYCADMFALLEHLKLSTVIAIGTSMGGIMAMMMAATQPGVFSKVIINDIGPDIDPKGLDRIKGYVGGPNKFDDWDAAVAAIKAQGPDIFPDYTEADWLAFAKRICETTPDGKLRFAYDPAISKPIKTDGANAAPPDMWSLYSALYDMPVLVIRGALSDILSKETAQKMAEDHPNCRYSEIPNIGHAPMLTEPESLLAIERFLKADT